MLRHFFLGGQVIPYSIFNELGSESQLQQGKSYGLLIVVVTIYVSLRNKNKF